MMSKAGFFVYKDQVQVPPGKYTLETAVMDHEAKQDRRKEERVCRRCA